MREREFKLIEFYDSGQVELYNPAEDIGESNDLSGTRRDKLVPIRGFGRLEVRDSDVRRFGNSPDSASSLPQTCIELCAAVILSIRSEIPGAEATQ